MSNLRRVLYPGGCVVLRFTVVVPHSARKSPRVLQVSPTRNTTKGRFLGPCTSLLARLSFANPDSEPCELKLVSSLAPAKTPVFHRRDSIRYGSSGGEVGELAFMLPLVYLSIGFSYRVYQKSRVGFNLVGTGTRVVNISS